MRIALVTTSWPAGEQDPGGHFVRASARELEQQGHRVEVVAPRAGGAFGWPGASTRLRERPLRAFEAAAWIVRARRELEHLDVDLVVAHWAVPCAWPIALSSRRRRARAPGRLEVVSHGGDVRFLKALPRPLRDHVARAIASRAAVWTFVSGALQRELLETLGTSARAEVERIARVRAPPLEMPDVRDAIARLRRSLGTVRTAVSVGRLVATKRVDWAIRHVARTRDVDTLVVVGDGPERPRLEQLARALGVDARFMGAVGRDQALAWIGAADALLHASTAEGLSTVVREAEALGTRVVRI